MKAIKRAMAGEYSRELGVKVFDGLKRLAELGFKQGGPPGLGYQRLLVSEARNPKQILAHGERKSIATDRVTLVPGPDHEVELVREIYRLFTVERMGIKAIASELNRRGIPSARHANWTHSVVREILSHPRYVGCNVFNQTTKRLGGPWTSRPRSEWIITPSAHQGIVDVKTFAKAQEIFDNQTRRKTDERVLSELRSLLDSKGKLTPKIIDGAVGMASSRTYCFRFGGLLKAYELIGYKPKAKLSSKR
jgi:hypothetical protein